MNSSPLTLSLFRLIPFAFKALRASLLEGIIAVFSARKSTIGIPAFKSDAVISNCGTPSKTAKKVSSSILRKDSEVALPNRICEASKAE